MNGKHFEIGTIQAFLDGETTPDVSLRLTDHVASCDSCARLLATAEEESSFVFAALERELNTLVPTQRLWTRINESISVEKKTSIWERFAHYVRASLANPSIAVAAGIILVVGMFAILWIPNGSGPVVVSVPSSSPNSSAGNAVAPTGSDPAPVLATAQPDAETGNKATFVRESSLSPQKLGKILTVDRRPISVPTAQYASDAYLPGEESYVKTIADLKQNVDSQKDDVLTPSNRVSYERDMAVVNDSISRMREVVRKNPRNQAARQVLYSSYQDKIDLMNSVAQREEMIASLR